MRFVGCFCFGFIVEEFEDGVFMGDFSAKGKQ